MKTSMQLKVSQQLAMTPQLQQAIRLLQLSTLELEAEIEQALEMNPLLERAEEESDEEYANDLTEEISHDEVVLSENTTTIPDELTVDSVWDDTYPTSYANSNDQEPFDYYAHTPQSISLTDYLLAQMRLNSLSETDKIIGAALIDAIDDQGYLHTSLQEIQQAVSMQSTVEKDEIEAVLHCIQQFDPIGVGARDLKECLRLQLKHLPANTPSLQLAQLLVSEALPQLGNKQYSQILRKFKISRQELNDAITLIQALSPKPGHTIYAETSPYIIPDVMVYRLYGKWQVELNPDHRHKLCINQHYSNLIKRNANSNADNNYLRNQLQEARWLLKSLESRNQTLLKVTTCIIEHQMQFLEKGEEAMQPLVLHQVAKAVGMHESTVSRVTTQKYMHTPRGIFELKYFFSSHVGTHSGEEKSSVSIRALIKKLVNAEEPHNPLSDNQIATLLQQQGIQVARRTVAKYREALHIPPSSKRKQLQ